MTPEEEERLRRTAGGASAAVGTDPTAPQRSPYTTPDLTGEAAAKAAAEKKRLEAAASYFKDQWKQPGGPTASVSQAGKLDLDRLGGPLDPTRQTPVIPPPSAPTPPPGAGDLDEARRLRTQLLDRMNQPGALAPTVAATPQVGAPAPVTAPTVTAATVAPAVTVGQTTVQRTAPMQAATVGPLAQAGRTVVGPVAEATAARIAPVERVTAAQVGGPQDQVRARQVGLLDRLNAIEAGTAAPSVAELQLKRGLDAAVGDQLGIAAQARGFGGLAALKQAGRNVAKIQQQTNLDTAMLRAKESEDARRQLLGALDSTRGMDINVGTTDANLKQDAAKFSAGAANTAGIAQAGMDTDVSKANAGFKNTAGLTQAQIDAEREKFNAGETNKGTLTEAGFKQDAAKTNTMVTSDESKAQASIDSQKALADAEAANKVNALAATFAQQAGMTKAQLDADVAKFNTEIAQRADFKNADLTQQSNLANLQSELQQRGLNQAQQLAYLQGALQSQGQVLDYSKAKMMADAARSAADRQFWGGIAGTLITGLATAAPVLIAASDRRMKTDITPMDSRRDLLSKMEGDDGKDELAQLLDGIRGYKYRYKDLNQEGTAPGEHFGPMAQDLEKAGPIGRSLVRDTPTGKMVDGGRAAMVALTALAKMREESARKKGARA
jgi:endosialidase-like protein